MFALRSQAASSVNILHHTETGFHTGWSDKSSALLLNAIILYIHTTYELMGRGYTATQRLVRHASTYNECVRDD